MLLSWSYYRIEVMDFAERAALAKYSYSSGDRATILVLTPKHWIPIGQVGPMIRFEIMNMACQL